MEQKPEDQVAELLKLAKSNPDVDAGQLGEVLRVLAELKELGVSSVGSGTSAPFQETVFRKRKKREETT